MSNGWKEQMGAYRFFDNEKVTEQALVMEMTNACARNCNGRDLLVFSDSSSFNMGRHRKSLEPGSGFGLIEDNRSVGFYIHTCLALDIQTHSIIGLSDCQLWNREEGTPDKKARGYENLDISEKSSYRWIKGCRASQQVLAGADSITFVEDREGDIYEQFAWIPDQKTHLIVRSRDNRRLSGGVKLHDAVKDAPVLGYYELDLETDHRKGRKKGKVKLAVRAARVEILKPRDKKDKTLPEKISLTIVEAKECEGASSRPLCWRLLTDIGVRDFSDAMIIINNYEQRWYIEELHRVVKKQGYNIEGSQLEDGWAVRKLTVMLLRASVRILQMWLAYDNEQGQDTGEVFTQEEIAFLEQINETGNDGKKVNINPYPPNKLTWATWIIAKLGGWMGYKSQHKPGPITMIRGYEIFQSMYQGWIIANLFNSKRCV